MHDQRCLSIVIPVFNEEQHLTALYLRLMAIIQGLPTSYEIIFVNDGSNDGSQRVLDEIAHRDSGVRIIEFTRNFGKEAATTAGLAHARGDAVMMVDADLQHPIDRIPEFVAQWMDGAEVVVGVRRTNAHEPWMKRFGSKVFYWIMDHVSDIDVTANATDFRLLDRCVVDAYNDLSERNRMTRALIDWLGFRRVYLPFDTVPRQGSKPSYTFSKLLNLAITSIVASSLFPLRLAGYLGVIIVLFSSLLGTFVVIEKYVLNDPWHFAISGSAQLAILILFLIGVVLMCLGLIVLYIAHIHREVVQRPMYVVRKSKLSS